LSLATIVLACDFIWQNITRVYNYIKSLKNNTINLSVLFKRNMLMWANVYV
jgi:hypothetical protein